MLCSKAGPSFILSGDERETEKRGKRGNGKAYIVQESSFGVRTEIKVECGGKNSVHYPLLSFRRTVTLYNPLHYLKMNYFLCPVVD